MVNTGRPSRACDPCKERHTKCDERRPTCSRCQRARRKCTGYKDDFDVNLRNETHVVVQRMRAREAYSQRLQNPLATPYEPQAVALFLDNFVLDAPDARYSKGFLASLLPLIGTAQSGSLLFETVDAVALQFLATSAANGSIATRAARSYLRALNQLQMTLDHEVHCISTETMISVYLMGLYEIMIPPKKTLHPWLSHLHGLTAIIKTRSKKSNGRCSGIDYLPVLDSTLSRSAWAMDHHTGVKALFPNTSVHNEKYPCIKSDLEGGFKFTCVANGHSIRALLDDLILRTQPILQAAASMFESSQPESRENVEYLISMARSQLSSLMDWPSTMPERWQPIKLHCLIETFDISQLDMFAGDVDVYPNLLVAAMWNTYRTTLLRLCDVIAQCGECLETDTIRFRDTDECQALRIQAGQAAREICSSVAYHVNNDWVHLITNAGLNPSPKALGGLLLIWPLYAGSILSIVPSVHRTWMRRKLRSIGISMGFTQAVVLADTVDIGKRTDPLKPLIISLGQVFMWSATMF